MSSNKYMHPRNIYRAPPNFKQLAVEFPDFRSYIIQDVTGKVTIDFKDIKTLRALTCTLLKKDFGLDVEIPLTRMIPTVPLRLNYILWLEDLLNISPKDDVITGIDIGTGASCIYPLISAKSKGWHMIATDIDEESLEWAQRNIEHNALHNLIKLKKISNKTILKEALEGEISEFDFCMCNPPFFASVPELNPLHKARRIDRPRPRNAFCATTNEVIADGGEVNFIRKIIEESCELGKRIKIYTTMVGHKYNLPQLKKLLREIDVISFKQTEFHQGFTTRWGLAWTFHDIDLRTLPEATIATAKKLKQKSLQHRFSSQELTDVVKKLKDIFSTLCLNIDIVKESKNSVIYNITAASNTWSHQRRKRREQQRLSTGLGDNNNDAGIEEIQSASELIANMKVASPKGPTKRELEEEGYYNLKRVKLDSGDAYEECYLKCAITIQKQSSDVIVDMVLLEGVAGREGVHQILQYIKNTIKL